MTRKIIQTSDDFWNIRGSYKILGLIDLGTQASLVRLQSGKFVLLDSYTLTGEPKKLVMELTDNGEAVEAILNLHPFHTLHCANMHRDFPAARLFGTARHVERLPELPWESLRTEDVELQQEYSDDFEFSIPRGVEFISDNEKVHFSSVLAYHPSSLTIHVDDTFVYARKRLSFHPTLAKVLEKRAGAVAEFREWAETLATEWGQAENLCAAHISALTANRLGGTSMGERILKALDGVSGKLDAHERKYGQVN
jgi:hypothetical protein